MSDPEVSLDQLVESYQKASAFLEEVEAEKSVLRDAILEELTRLQVRNGVKVYHWLVQKITYWDYSAVPLAFADTFGAVKVEKKPNTALLKKIDEAGKIEIPGKVQKTRLRIDEEKK